MTLQNVEAATLLSEMKKCAKWGRQSSRTFLERTDGKGTKAKLCKAFLPSWVGTQASTPRRELHSEPNMHPLLL